MNPLAGLVVVYAASSRRPSSVNGSPIRTALIVLRPSSPRTNIAGSGGGGGSTPGSPVPTVCDQAVGAVVIRRSGINTIEDSGIRIRSRLGTSTTLFRGSQNLLSP